MTVMVARAGVEQQIESICTTTLEEMGFRLVRVRYQVTSRAAKKLKKDQSWRRESANENFGQLQFMIERMDKTLLSVGDCALVHRHVSTLLDVADPINHTFQLEISSPGLQRPLTKNSDFADYIGFDVDLTLAQMQQGRRRFKGCIQAVSAENIELIQEDGEVYQLPFVAIGDAKLQLNDTLLAAAKSDSSDIA